MAKIDMINKEIDFIRSLLLALIAIVISIIIGLIGRYDDQKIDVIFWIGFVLEPIILITILKITKILVDKIKELGEIDV